MGCWLRSSDGKLLCDVCKWKNKADRERRDVKRQTKLKAKPQQSHSEQTRNFQLNLKPEKAIAAPTALVAFPIPAVV